MLFILNQVYRLYLLCELNVAGSTAYRAHFGGGRRPAWRFDALDYRKIKHGNAGPLGTYDILSVLPDKSVKVAICLGGVRNFAWQQFPRNCCYTIL